MIYKPTAEHTKIFKKCASMESVPHRSASSIILEPGWRFNTDDDDIEPSMNIALVTDNEDWDDTDLADHGRYRDLCRGIALTEDGRGVFDFYISAYTADELLGNITAYVEKGELVRVAGYGAPGGATLWSKEGGFA